MKLVREGHKNGPILSPNGSEAMQLMLLLYSYYLSYFDVIEMSSISIYLFITILLLRPIHTKDDNYKVILIILIL